MKTFLLIFIAIIFSGTLHAFEDERDPHPGVGCDEYAKKAVSYPQGDPKTTNYWTGNFNHLWGNTQNWSLGTIPGAGDDVNIPNVNMPCIIDYSDKSCHNITIQSGAAVTIYDQAFNVTGDADVYGAFYLNSTASGLNISGDIIWESGSTGSMTGSSTIKVYGDWDFKSGANVQFATGYVEFAGTSTSYIRSYESNCSFYNLKNNKATSMLAVSGLSTEDLHIAGNIYNYNNCTLGCYSSHSIILEGFFNNIGGHFYFNAGTFVFDGYTSNVPLKPNEGDYFNNLTVDLYNGTLNLEYTYTGAVTIKGDLLISGGVLDATHLDINIKGDWNNTVGSSGFIPGDISFVRFNGGNYHQYCSNETFGYLEINKPDGGALRIDGANVVCNYYVFTAGAIDVISGSFTANDTYSGYDIIGAFYLNEGGTINISCSNLSSMDCDLFIFGGTMNIYGNSDYVTWAIYNDFTINMSGGILDFKDIGLIIPNGIEPITENITAGTIRIAKGFSGEDPDFTPTAGTFEFYGSSDYSISQSGGCTLYNVNIDKSTKKGESGGTDKTVNDERSGMAMESGSKTNTILLGSDFVVTNNLTITSGGLELNGHELTVKNDFDIYGEIQMNDTDDILNVGTELGGDLKFNPGSSGIFSSGVINVFSDFYIDMGSSFTATSDNTINFTGEKDISIFFVHDTTSVFANIDINKAEGFNIFDSYHDINVYGNLTLFPGNYLDLFSCTLHTFGDFTDSETSYILVDKETKANEKNQKSSLFFNKYINLTGSVIMESDFILNGKMVVDSGSVTVHGIFGTAPTGVLNIYNGGTFIADAPNHAKGWETLNGSFKITDGLFEITNNSIKFGSTATTEVSGGVLRTGGAFYALNSNVFQPTGGVVEITGASSDNTIYCYYGNYFYDLTINRNPGISCSVGTGAITVKNDLTINSGILNPSGYDIYVGGDWTNNVGNGGFVEGTGTVIFNGSQNATITTNEIFYNLKIDKTSPSYNGLSLNPGITVKVLNDLQIFDGTLEMNNNSTLDINGSLYIENGAGLNAAYDTGLSIFIAGGWNDANTTISSTTGYYPGSEVVTFDGSGGQILTTSASREEFGNLIINKSSDAFRPDDDIYVYGDFSIENGEWADYSNGLSHSFEGDFIVQSGGNFNNSLNKNTVNIISDEEATIHFDSPGNNNSFNVLNIDKSTITKSGNYGDETGLSDIETKSNSKGDPKTGFVNFTSDIICKNTMSVQQTILYLNGHTLSTGDVNINIDGVVNALNGSVLKVNSDKSININNGGILNLIGESDNKSKVTHSNSGYYALNVFDGGSLAAQYAIFEYLNGYGVNVYNGATVNEYYSFNFCTFKDVFPDTYSSDITLENDQILNSYGADFPDNPGHNVWKSINAGDITFHNATGDFAGPEFEHDPFNHIQWSDMDLDINIKVILAGPYNGTDMNTDLNTLGLIPLNQPFNSNTNADWYYTGTESVSSIPANVVDWVLIQIRDASDAASADNGTVVDTKAAFLLNDGSIVDLDGTSNLTFTGISYSSGLFPVVWHRNHLGVISSTRMTRTGGVYTFDFTAAGSAYSNSNAGETYLGGGVWGLFSGDASGDGLLDAGDITSWANDAGSQGYFPGDMNLDSQVGNVDKNDFCVGNFGNESQIPGSNDDDN